MTTAAAYDAAMTGFEWASGSVNGRRHRLAGKNNQDAFAVVDGPITVAVVCDGCGSCQQSEVGAAIGAPIVANAVASALQRLDGALSSSALLKIAFRQACSSVEQVVMMMEANRSKREAIVSRYFLFTVVGVAITETCTFAFSLGDGVIYLNNHRIQIGPFPFNAPPYLGYAITPSQLWPKEGLGLSIHAIIPTNTLRHALIGTDGILDLESALPPSEKMNQFWEEDRYFHEKDAITRKLDWYSQLADDTTLITMRTKKI